MMKKLILPVFLFSQLSGLATVNSQDLPFRKEINYIDSVLQKNPSTENFLGITYYYSVDVTAEKELIVVMDFKGPFTTTFKARLADLPESFVVDTSEFRSSVCWHCGTDSTGREKRCIKQEILYTSGEKEIVDSEDICIMLPAESDIRLKLLIAIEELVKKVRE
jgi:hypothetical protein